MAATLLGSLTVGECVPAAAALQAAALAELNAQLAGALSLSASISISPPTLALSLEAALNAVAAIQAQLALNLSLGLPEVSVDLTAMAAVTAELNAQIAILLALAVALGTAGVFAFTHDGAVESFGSEMDAQLAGVVPAGQPINAITFVATAPAVWTALGAILRTA